MYRSERMLTSTEWLERFENLLGYLTATWDGLIVVTGDINIDLLRPNKPITSQYQFILSSLNLHQHVHKPTRTTDKTSTLIDHIISNLPERIPHYIKVTRFQIRHKFIRNLKNFDESSFIEDFKTLPFAASFGVSDPDEKLEILSSLRKECIDRHALLELTKVTRPPAPWLKDPAIAELKEQRDRLRSAARTSNNNKEIWEKFRATRKRLKELIKSTERNFMERMWSSKKPKEVWKEINRILHPSPQRISMQPDKLNNFFASTAERTISINAHHVDDYALIINLIQSLPANFDNGFQIRTVTLKEVIHELRNIRTDCSTGLDNIPANMIKMVADYLGSPLTDVINTCIKNFYFLSAWKLARICTILKGSQIKSEKDLRPISILPVLSKVYERLIFRQLSVFFDKNNVLNNNISAYRKGQSTTTLLQAIRDDIVKAMKRSVTMMILADFSKAFDTICFTNLITKMSKLGFPRDFLIWTLNYITHRKQFIQIDDTCSEVKNVNFGVPQGSIMGPVRKCQKLPVCGRHNNLRSC